MRIAVFGCGQLSRMMALPGVEMGHEFSFLADDTEDTRCVAGLGEVVRRGDHDVQALYRMLGSPEVITVEKEQVDVVLLAQFESLCKVYPSPGAVAACRDRSLERALLDRLGIPCAKYILGGGIEAAAGQLGLPLVAKSLSEGYDGKNQWRIQSPEDIQRFQALVLAGEIAEDALIYEQWVAFRRELSQVSVRTVDGHIKHYPLVENHHHNGILERTIAPAAEVSAELESTARGYIESIMEEYDYVGVLAMELFDVEGGLLVNELAPRVHNSGHWTQSGSATSQFENHVLAITGAAAADTRPRCVTVMINLVGIEKPLPEDIAPSAELHWYDKVVRPGRKLGHINYTGATLDELVDQLPPRSQHFN